MRNRRARGAILALMTVLALATAGASGAAAATLESQVLRPQLYLTGGVITLETAEGRVVTCESAAGPVEWNSSVEMTGLQSLEGCFAERIPLMQCGTVGAPAGTIKTKWLTIRPVTLDPGRSEAGLLFEPATSAGLLAEFHCELLSAQETLRVKGSVIAKVPNEQLNSFRSSLDLEFRQSGGTPEPALVEGQGQPHVLQVAGFGTEPFPYEEAGLQELFPGESTLNAGHGAIALRP